MLSIRIRNCAVCSFLYRLYFLSHAREILLTRSEIFERMLITGETWGCNYLARLKLLHFERMSKIPTKRFSCIVRFPDLFFLS
jgi:hypothetical protein